MSDMTLNAVIGGIVPQGVCDNLDSELLVVFEVRVRQNVWATFEHRNSDGEVVCLAKAAAAVYRTQFHSGDTGRKARNGLRSLFASVANRPGPFNCKCQDLAHHVTGDGCDEFNPALARETEEEDK